MELIINKREKMQSLILEKIEKRFCNDCGHEQIKSTRTGFWFCHFCAGIPYSPQELKNMQENNE